MAKSTSKIDAEHVEVIDKRLSGPMLTVYLAANMAAVARSSLTGDRRPNELELSTVLDHMSDILTEAAEALATDQIIPYAERAEREVAHG